MLEWFGQANASTIGSCSVLPALLQAHGTGGTALVE
jgi:hypothetical protein